MENISIIFKKSVIFVIIIFLLINSCLVIGVEHKTKDTCGNYSDLIFEKISNNWWNNSFSYRKLITVNHTQVDATLSDFPILVHTDNDSDLSSHAQIEGDDICFVLFSDNTTKLNHEIENYCNGTLWAWVNVTQLDANYDTNIWMYYGNSTCDSQEYVQGTWDSNFVGVWHLVDYTSNTVLDSTSYNNDGTKAGGGSPVEIDAVIYKGQHSADQDGDYITCPDDSSLDVTQNFTLEAWMRFPTFHSYGNTDHVVVAKSSDYNGEYGMWVDESGGIMRVGFGHQVDSGCPLWNVKVGGWHYIVGTNDGTNFILSENSSIIQSTNSKIIPSGSSYFHIGGGSAGLNRQPEVDLDEVRLSKIVRSTSWITTSYNSMSNIENFYLVGEEEPINHPPYKPNNPHPNQGSTNVNINVDLSWNGGDPDGDNVTYDVYFGESSTPPKVSENQSSNTYDPGVLQVEKTYYWKIVAWDINHGICTQGPLWWFSTEDNRPPCKPVIFDSPDFARPGEILEFSAVAIDPEGNDIFYMWDWDDGSNSDWIGPFESGQTVKEDHVWDKIGKYLVTVRVKDTKGAEGYLSDPKVLVVEDKPPEIDFTKPLENNIYFWNERVTSFFTTIIVGPIDIIADASDNISGIDRVEFYLNNIRKNIDYSIPYIWSWHGFAFYFRVKTLGIVAFDKAGNQASHNIIVGKFF